MTDEEAQALDDITGMTAEALDEIIDEIQEHIDVETASERMSKDEALAVYTDVAGRCAGMARALALEGATDPRG